MQNSFIKLGMFSYNICIVPFQNLIKNSCKNLKRFFGMFFYNICNIAIDLLTSLIFKVKPLTNIPNMLTEMPTVSGIQ